MTFDEALLREVGSVDLRYAASILASRVRADAEAADPLLEVDGELRNTPLTYQRLAEIGKLCGIVSYEFGAPISAEAELRPLPGGGLQMRTVHASPTGRALFAVAHEIGHTFFYDLTQKPPRRVVGREQRDSALDDAASRQREEEFCDKFAWRLLLPEETESEALDECARARTPRELVKALERVRRWGISIGISLLKLNEFGWFPNDLLAVVLRWQPHFKSQRDPALRVAASYPAPSAGFFVPRNQRAASIGFTGAIRLIKWWNEFPNRNAGVSYKRSGKLGFQSIDGELMVAENDAIDDSSCIEELKLWTRQSQGARWTRFTGRLPVTYRFYGVSPTEAYCLCIVDLVDVRKSQHAGASDGSRNEEVHSVHL